MKIIKKYIIFLLLITVFCPVAHSQDDMFSNQIWLDFIPHKKLNNKLEYYGDMSFRTLTNNNDFSRFGLKPTLRYYLNYKFDLIGGLGFSLTKEAGNYNTLELRPYQGVRVSWPNVWRLNIKHRGLIEERFLWNNEDEYNLALRFRYRIKTKIPLNNPSIQYKTIFIPVSYEMFLNNGGDEVDKLQNRARLMTGLGYVINNKWVAEIEAIFQKSRSTETDKLTLSDRIFRFKLTYAGRIFGE